MKVELCAMRPKSAPSALKHGGYSGLTLLPGEDPADFERLRRELIAELEPRGRLEEEIVADIARLFWRKQNLPAYEITKLVRYLADALTIGAAAITTNEQDKSLVRSIPELEAIMETSDRLEAEQRSAAHELEEIDIRKMATLEGLMKELDVEERLGAMIDKCLKRLLLIRGFKSLAPSIAAEAPSPTRRRLRSV